jgi:diaminopimelate decarboxylase
VAATAPQIGDFAKQITDAVAAACIEHGISVPKLAFEPGRAIAGPAGVTLYTVGTIKDVRIDDSIRKYVSIDGGMSDNMRTALYQAAYTVRLASRVSSADQALVRVVGRHCESGDIVVRDDYLPGDVANGDTLAVAATGAYCFSLANNYNFLTRPPVVAVRSGKARLIVRGETEADLFDRDVELHDKFAPANKDS